MKIVCISASNVEMAKGNSTSTRVCEMIRDLVYATAGAAHQVEVVPLVGYELNPCNMCGACLKVDACHRDEAFTRIYTRLIAADAAFFVVPHYAPIPSKLIMLLEKLEEMIFLRCCADPHYHFTLYQKPVGIIVHGGQTEEALPYYRSALLEPVAAALASVQMKVIGVDEIWDKGIAFGIQNMQLPEGSVFVTFQFDWDAIRTRVASLVEHVLAVGD